MVFTSHIEDVFHIKIPVHAWLILIVILCSTFSQQSGIRALAAYVVLKNEC